MKKRERLLAALFTNQPVELSAFSFQLPASSFQLPASSFPQGFPLVGGGGVAPGAPGAGCVVVPPGAPKSTVGASRAPGFVTWKYFRSFAPVSFAVSTAGKRRM
jgi:hypothetical protein